MQSLDNVGHKLQFGEKASAIQGLLNPCQEQRNAGWYVDCSSVNVPGASNDSSHNDVRAVMRSHSQSPL